MFIGDDVEPLPLEPPISVRNWLLPNIYFYLIQVYAMSQESLHDSVWKRFKENDENVHSGLLILRKAARTMSEGLNRDRRDSVVEALNRACEGVDAIDETIHEPFKTVIEPLQATKHVMGWKAVGAGAGGCAILLVRPSAQDVVTKPVHRSRLVPN